MDGHCVDDEGERSSEDMRELDEESVDADLAAESGTSLPVEKDPSPAHHGSVSSSVSTGQQNSADSANPKASVSSSSSPAKSKSPAKAGDPKFLSEFYSHSRLHHISTWGAEFRAYVSKLQKESKGSYPGRERLRQFHVERMEARGLGDTLESSRCGRAQRAIMHVDMDCFFVSVGLLKHPEYRGEVVTPSSTSSSSSSVSSSSSSSSVSSSSASSSSSSVSSSSASSSSSFFFFHA